MNNEKNIRKGITATLFAVMMVVSVLAVVPVVSATVTVYPDDRPGWESAVGYYQEEFFTDATLNPGVSVVTDLGHVDELKGVWWDKLVCPGYSHQGISGPTTTTWQFKIPLVGFGGNWNPWVPGGPGANISVDIGGVWVNIGEIPNTYNEDFWGFVSDTPFSAVRLSNGSNCNGAWCETYELDNMVYSSLWGEINVELDALIAKVRAAGITPSIIEQRLVDKLEYAKKLKDNAKEEYEDGNVEAAKKKLKVAKSQVESFESMVRITRRIDPAAKAGFLAESAAIKAKIDTLIERIQIDP